MAVRAKLDVKGFADYLEKIAKANLDINKITANALEAGGNVLLTGMRRRVPKLTHNLEDSLVIDGPHTDGNYVYVLVGLSKSADADTVRYGNVQEYGASDTPAQPYIRPSLDIDMKQAKLAIKKVFEDTGIV